MKKLIAILLVPVLVFSLCACMQQKKDYTQKEALAKLVYFFEIFDFSEKKTYRYEPLGEIETDGKRYYGFEVYWLEEDGETYMGKYLINKLDGSLLPA